MCEYGAPSLSKRFLVAVFVIALAALSAESAVAAIGNGKLQIHHIDVSQGDGILIISPQGQLAMVDDGTYTNCSLFVNYIKGLGITSFAHAGLRQGRWHNHNRG